VDAVEGVVLSSNHAFYQAIELVGDYIHVALDGSGPSGIWFYPFSQCRSR
jgi:hypothetical protein